MQHKYGEQWDLINLDTRNVFASCTPIMIKCILRTNNYGERIKCAHKSKTTSACPLCGEIEDCNHFYCVSRIRIK